MEQKYELKTQTINTITLGTTVYQLPHSVEIPVDEHNPGNIALAVIAQLFGVVVEPESEEE